ncbi:hypothetical protein Rsub_06933 [Raphidocelis subcapitata]|uniref:Calponin-homology (CH) domain-containing protein n=1 Tax=Raphidocelis subcapitata TaxID=307507 RepID=A0A2V0P358_9CHLO|nr:hypothetical protein Rsub_06933 [Raphidocelis subcapitata]|eukprot:GBF94311.1 hypothetical protein Rsub_06933 [Raphidocelis subcapitata]
MDVSEDELQSLYTWVDEIPLSRPKRNIARDFSDGVLVAEVVSHFFPKVVELHNYSSANSMQQKLYNWNTLNNKVFRKLGFRLPKEDQMQCANSVAGAIERVLKLLRIHIDQCQARGGLETATPTFSTLAASPPGGSPSGPPSAAAAAPPSPAGALRCELPAASAAMAPILSSYLSGSKAAGKAAAAAAAAEALAEKEQAIAEMREMNEILETKVRKLEQLVKLKDAKIHTLMAKLQAAGLL